MKRLPLPAMWRPQPVITSCASSKSISAWNTSAMATGFLMLVVAPVWRFCRTRGKERLAHMEIDYAENMVAFAQRHLAEEGADLEIEIKQASVLELPFADNSFDVVTSHRCLMALLDWKKQQSALMEIARVLKPGGMLILMEGTLDGIERLNNWRVRFGLPEIDAAGRDRLTTLKFRESELLGFVNPTYELQRVQRWGMYYFLTRIVQPLLVAPEPPKYSHKLNEVAKVIARQEIPDLNELGHLVGFALRKRP